MSEVIVVRTHYYDPQLDKMVRRLQRTSARRVVVVVDERRSKINIPADLLKIVLDPAADGLPMPSDYGWRCGDYSLYAALKAVPDASHFWLIEPDVRIHSEDPSTFFDGGESTAAADLLTAWFVVSSAEWVWHRTIAPFERNVYNCMLQLCRVSRPAVDWLLRERIALGSRFESKSLGLNDWPNDEAFIGAALMRGGFKIATFASHAPSYRTAGIFTFDKPTSARWLEGVAYDRGIYHPVVSGQKFMTRLRDYLNAPSRRGPDGAPGEASEIMKEQILAEQELNPL